MSKNLCIVTAQLNYWVGDITGNKQKILTAIKKARDEIKADIIVFPELALTGYPPEDLLFRPDFQQQTLKALHEIKNQTQGIAVILGHPDFQGKKAYNAISVLQDKQIVLTYHKQCLPNYGVFDEKRYFTKGKTTSIFNYKNIPIGLIICEDLWYPEPVAEAKKAGAKLIICINASPLDINKAHERERVMRMRIQENCLPILYAHQIGGQDDLVFDGGSLAMDATGKICGQANYYKEELFTIHLKVNNELTVEQQPLPAPLILEAHIYQALVLSVHDYVTKNGFPGVILGLSGGIDSALTLAIAVDALGKDRVHAVALPSRYSAQLSFDLAKVEAEKLGVKLTTISIEACFNALLESLAPQFTGLAPDTTEENIQARCRGILLMALSNKSGSIVLTTGNKSELSVGYSTLYGDMAGGFAVLKDVWKLMVYRLAHYRNTLSPVIPHGVIERAPSAELAVDQKDEDSLPPYRILDPILEMYVEQDKSAEEIIAAGYNPEVVHRIISLVDRNEYKRRQAPPGPRITIRAFGRERRYPITSKFKTFA